MVTITSLLWFGLLCSTNVHAAAGVCSPPNVSNKKTLRRLVDQANLVVVGTLLDLNRKMTYFDLGNNNNANNNNSPVGINSKRQQESPTMARGREGRILIRRVFKGKHFLSSRFNELSTAARILTRIPAIFLSADAEGLLQIRATKNTGNSSSDVEGPQNRISDDFVAYLREGLLNVHGFYSSAICKSDAERFDTRIFLLTKMQSKRQSSRKRVKQRSRDIKWFRWRLLTTPFHLNWRMIQAVESAVSYLKNKKIKTTAPTSPAYNYKSTSLPTSTSRKGSRQKGTTKRQRTCSDITCTGPSEMCSYVDGVPKCVCPSSCPSSNVQDSSGLVQTSNPNVCGTDGKTYETMCHLARAQCLSKSRSLTFKHTGSCDVPDPCLTTNCTYGAVCERSLDGLTSRCICPRNCPAYGTPSVTLTVCGSDNTDYPSLCELRKAACMAMKEIQPLCLGKCDPCKGVKCPTSRHECIVEATTRQPRCVCPDKCQSMPYTPLCGTNGKTYSHICYLQLDACRLNMSLGIYQNDVTSCRRTSISCTSSSCSGPGEECIMATRTDRPKCICPFTEVTWKRNRGRKKRISLCPKMPDQICGQDNVTYRNDCELRRISCLRRRSVDIQFYGNCEDGRLCSSVECLFGAKCSVFRRKLNRRQLELLDDQDSATSNKLLGVSPVITCRCPDFQCSYNHRPVCGSDSNTYTNECIMRQAACRLQKNITMIHRGQCGGCADLTCPYFAKCVIEPIEGQPQCQCPKNCPTGRPVICGSDNQTYLNYCEMTVAACRLNVNLTARHEGYCDRCKNVICPAGKVCDYGRCVCRQSCVEMDAPVCGSDGRTYATECHMQMAVCKKGLTNVTIAFRRPCDNSFQEKPALLPTPKPFVDEGCSPLNCRFGGNCELDIADGSVKCLCSNFTCLEIRDPVCASDGKLYGNVCEMHKVSCQLQKLISKVPLSECQNLEPLPCNGRQAPLTNAYGVEYDCLESATSACPAKSFCHRGPTFAVCCPEERGKTAISSQSNRRNRLATPPPLPARYRGLRLRPPPVIASRRRLGFKSDEKPSRRRFRKHIFLAGTSSVKTLCETTSYGCCRDGASVAHGPQGQGCPEWCQCDPIGSFGSLCSLPTGQCMCRPGVTGLKCQKCMDGFYSLSPINHPRGCIPCDCDVRGTMSGDLLSCNKESGQCVCRHAAAGRRCDRCAVFGQVLTGEGQCILPTATLSPKDELATTTCSGVVCQFGAVCKKSPENGEEKCSCEALKCSNQLRPVCASDRRSYANKCHMRLSGCRSGRRLRAVTFGFCDNTNQKANFADEPDNTNGDSFLPLPTEASESGRIKQCDQRLNFQCLHGGTCYVDDTNSARCLCVIGKTGTYCELDEQTTEPSFLTTSSFKTFPPQLPERSTAAPLSKFDSRYFVPSFSSHSFMKLKRPRKVSSNLTIEMEVRALRPSGTVVYIGDFETNKKRGGRRYSSASSRTDYVALVLRKNFIEFRFDVGAGMRTIRSGRALQLKRFHFVVAHWSAEDSSAYLQLDNDRWQAATPRRSLRTANQTLELALPVVLGYVKGSDQRRLKLKKRFGGVRNGFVGCIQSLRITNSFGKTKIYSLVSTSRDVLFGRDINECGRSGACLNSPCLNGGTCIASNNMSASYSCVCPGGYSGRRCEVTSKCESLSCRNGGTCQLVSGTYPVCACPSSYTGPVCQIDKGNTTFVPLLTGRSYIERPPIGSLSIHFRIEIWFLATRPDGVLFLATSKPYGRGDFITLNLADGYIEAHVRHGIWAQRLLSEERIPLNVWTKAVMLRKKKGELILSINGRRSRTQYGRLMSGTSGIDLSQVSPKITVAAQMLRGRPKIGPDYSILGSDKQMLLPSTPMKLPLPYFIGGFRHFYDVPAESNVLYNFEGAIQRISIDRFNVADVLSGSLSMGGEIRAFMGPPCTSNPCLNGGLCQPQLASFRCTCPPSKVGDLCELDRKTLQTLVANDGPDAIAVRFNGSTILRFYNTIKRRERRQHSNRIRLRMRTLARNGCLALIRKAATVKSADFLIIALRDGFLEVAVNLGTGQTTTVRSNRRINNGNWHSIFMNRQQRSVTLIIDSEPEVIAFTPEGRSQLNSNGYLVVGGIDVLLKGLPAAYTAPFVGCMTSLELEGRKMELYSGRRSSARYPLSLCSAGDDQRKPAMMMHLTSSNS